MQLIKVAAGVLNQTPLAWDRNQANIVRALDEARAQQVSVLCLPELCISGYGCEDAFHAAGTWKTSWTILKELLPLTRGMIVSFGLPLLCNHALYNTACLVADGKLLGFTAKRFLAGDGIHYEPRWFKPWPLARRADVVLDDVSYPIGDIHFSCGGVKIGFEICEDAWVANRPGGELALAGADVILNPSASHFAFGKIDVRRRFVIEGSRAFGVSYVYTNLLGNEAGRAIYDGSTLIATGGQLIAEGPRFSFDDVQMTSAVVDIDATRMSQARIGSFEPSVEVADELCVVCDFDFPTVTPSDSVRPNTQPGLASWEGGTRVKEEEFTRAIALGLFDYLRKSRSHGFVVSLSGGADSAACASLVAMLVKLGVAELGRERFLEKLHYIQTLATAADERELIGRLLACVYQATRNSGDVTRNAAREVAKFLGAEYFEFDVDAQVQGYMQIVSGAIGRELDWKKDDIALQNIQARTRSPGVWMLTNIRNALLLSTSNRSEAAVGYATMDGDTSGGLSPIAGIDKNFIRHWLRWLESMGPSGLCPFPALAAVNHQAPTAELRPPSAAQTDEADLMPYDLLDAIERAAIRDKRSPLEVFQLMRPQFPQYPAADLVIWVERFFRLWCRNQWKRERYAPSFHVDDENLDPKTWCRFPILSGGFERELAELRRAAQELGAATGQKTSLTNAVADLPKTTLAEGRFVRLVRRGKWEFVERTKASGVVIIVPVTDAGEFVFVEQFRVPVDASCIEFPAGLAGDIAGQETEQLVTAAARELLEETGYEARAVVPLADGSSSAGLTSESVTFFLATGLQRVHAGGGDGSEEIQIHVIPRTAITDWLADQQRQGKVVAAKVFAGLWLAERELAKLAAQTSK